MQELYTDDDFEKPVAGRVPGSTEDFVHYYKMYRKIWAPDDRRQVALALFDTAAAWCVAHKVRPAFFVHAVFNAMAGAETSCYVFMNPKCIDAYKAWFDRVPTELLDRDISSPHSVDVHRELETMASMICTKYGKIEFTSLNFKIACADPVFDVTPCSRVILSDAAPIVLEHWGQDYLDWAAISDLHALVVEDFGMDHKQLTTYITHGTGAA